MKDYDVSYHNLLQLLSLSLFDKKPELSGAVDWDAIFVESVSQAVFPLVFSAAIKIAPREITAQWQVSFDKMIAANSRNFANHFEIGKILFDAGIPYVILKGAASARYYPNALLRSMGDVDFLVGELDVNKTRQTLLQLGFIEPKGNGNTRHLKFKRDGNGARSTFELHWHLPGMPKHPKILSRLLSVTEDAIYNFERIELLNGELNSPSALCHGIILLLHSAEHLYKSGLGLRHLCDWAVFVNSFSSEEFCSIFEDVLKECGLWDFCCCITAIAIKYLKCRNFDWATNDNQLCEDLLCDVFASGNFAIKDISRYNEAKLMSGYYAKCAESSVKLTNIIKSVIAKTNVNMPMCRIYKVLLPFGMMIIVLRHIFKILSKKRPRFNLKRAVKGADLRNRIYSKLNIFKIN